MNKLKKSFLLKKRAKLARQVAAIKPVIIRGSLIERYKRCGKPGCKCMYGKGHGPKYYLALSVYKGKPDVIYVPLDKIDRVKECLERYQKASAVLKKICDINRELLRRGETI